jgi:hypothetical protein
MVLVLFLMTAGVEQGFAGWLLGLANYLVHAWNHRNACKHDGVALAPPSAPVERGADADIAME